MDWRVWTLAVVLMYGVGVWMLFHANPIHGAKVSCFLQLVGYVVLLACLGFGRSDIARMTTASTLWGIGAAALFVGGTYAYFHAIALYPKQAPLIAIISEFYPLIAALIVHFSGNPLTGKQWLGAMLVTGGLYLVGVK